LESAASSRSLSKSDPSLNPVAIARIIKERGIRGEVKALPLSETAQHLHPQTDVQILTQSGQRETRKILSIRYDRGFLLVSFHDIATKEEAALLRNAVIEAPATSLPALPDNVYYHGQVIGLTVVTDSGDDLGSITEIMATGGTDVYVVRGRGREYLIPAIKDIVSRIDLDSGIMTITPMEGLLD